LQDSKNNNNTHLIKVKQEERSSPKLQNKPQFTELGHFKNSYEIDNEIILNFSYKYIIRCNIFILTENKFSMQQCKIHI
jgi:hypothetical protein